LKSRSLIVRAGARARDRLRREGFHRDLFGTLVGASGGPKWLVLRHIDDVLADRLIAGRNTPLDTLGSSIGSFRHACHAQADPKAALARFEQGYVEQAYEGDGRPSMQEISSESDRILALMLGEKGAREIVTNQKVRSHFVASRLLLDRGLDRGFGFQRQLASAALLNTIARRHLGRAFERVLFGPGDSPIVYEDFPTTRYTLDAESVQQALLASGSIPLVMQGVRDVPNVPGILFDGGIVDYHFDFEFARREGLVLFAHFFDRIVPGWFDRPLKWRRPAPEALEDVVMVAPSDAFVASLPGSKVPDRNDFLDLSTGDRIARWRRVIEVSRVLADDLNDLMDGNQVDESILPFHA
jgi:hypothetical protein